MVKYQIVACFSLNLHAGYQVLCHTFTKRFRQKCICISLMVEWFNMSCDQYFSVFFCTSSSFHATVARSSAVGPSLLRVRWPGTHCQTASEIRLCQPTLSDVI